MDRPFLRHFWGSQAHRLIVGEGNGQTPPITPICPSATGPGVPTDSPLGGSADRYRGSADAHGFLGGRLPHPRRRDRRQILHLIMNREPLAADLAGDGVARGWFRRRGKGQDFVFGLVHSLPWARRLPPGAALLGMARTVFTARVGPDCTSGWLLVGYLRAPSLASLSAVAVFGAGSCCAPRRSSLSAPRSRDARGGAPTFGPLGGHPLYPQQRRRPGGARVWKLSYGALVWGTRRGPTPTTIPPVGFGRFLV